MPDTLTTEYLDKRKHRTSILHDIEWYRVVLDEGESQVRSHDFGLSETLYLGTDLEYHGEAHTIRRQATTFFKACFDLSAVTRWCLTGTPIQNKLEDIGTLFAFIRARPFHTLTIFRQYIINPYHEGGKRRQVACERLVSLLDSLCLRRTKERLHLPGRQDRLVPVVLTERERNRYDSTKRTMVRIIRQRAGVYERHDTFSMFQAILQLRIFCNHGTFQRPFSWNRISRRDMREAAVSALGHNSEMYCSACKLPMPVLGSNRIHNKTSDQCSHVLCSECLEDSISASNTADDRERGCPLCERVGMDSRKTKLPKRIRDFDTLPQDFRLHMESLENSSEEIDDRYFQSNGYSSKMEALMRDVQNDLWATKRYSSEVTIFVRVSIPT